MSRKVMCSCADAKLAISRKDTTHRRETKPHPAPEGRLRIARRFSAGGTGQPERGREHHRRTPRVGLALAVSRLAGALFKIGSGTDTCSWMLCRSLLSSGLSWRYGPVIACEDSSALKRR